MKNKTFDCVEMKRQAQEQIYEETKNLTLEERLAYHQRSFARLKAKQKEMRARLSMATPAV